MTDDPLTRLRQYREGVPDARPTPSTDPWRQEMAEHYATLKAVASMDPADAFLTMASISARASEMRFEVMTTKLMRDEIDQLLSAVDRQYRLLSRVAAVREAELKTNTDRRLP